MNDEERELLLKGPFICLSGLMDIINPDEQITYGEICRRLGIKSPEELRLTENSRASELFEECCK